MRIAEDEHFHFIVCNLPFKICKINFIGLAIVLQFIANNITAVIYNRAVKVIVDRGLNQHLIAGFCKSLHNCRKRWNNARSDFYPFFLYFESMSLRPPTHLCFIIGIRDAGITENPMPDSLFECLNDWSCCPEIHIRYPHGQDIFWSRIPFHAICISSVDHLIKFILQGWPPLIPQCLSR
ncbi:hypothetical protein D3C75_391130 [compost metagenome]